MTDDERERIQAETVRAIVGWLREVAPSWLSEGVDAAIRAEAGRLERDWRAIVRGSR